MADRVASAPKGDAPMDLSEAPPLALKNLIAAADGKGRNAPVDSWNPSLCGTIDIRIASDGTWFHEGRPIQRSRLAKLFSALLRKDEDGVTYLVTPHEKLAITVDDAPLVVVDYAAKPSPSGDILVLRTSMGDVVEVDADHPLRFQLEASSGGLKPYVRVRGRIEALLNRSTVMALINDERFVDLSDETPMLTSGEARFAVCPT